VVLEERIAELKQIIAGNDGRNAADARFARAVDELVSAIYDDITRIRELPTRALFDLFVIKVLYVGRRSCYADIIDYLASLLETRMYTSALFPEDEHGRPRTLYFSDALDEQGMARFESRFDAYRTYADNALFMSGVFPQSLGPRVRRDGILRMGGAPHVDHAYYVTTGKAMYRMAAAEDEAEDTRQRTTLHRLAESFEIYVDALNEMSARFITGIDAGVVTDKMLDAYNRFRTSGDDGAMRDVAAYHALLGEADPPAGF
jgi:hypothetical protein